MPNVPPSTREVSTIQHTTPRLQATDVSYRYGNLTVPDSYSFSLFPGEIGAICGDNGVGKSTLLKLAAGLFKPAEGEILVDGRRPFGSPEVRRHIGYLGHEHGFYDELTLVENLSFFLSLEAKRGHRRRALLLLEQVGLENKATSRFSALSAGMKTRLGLARAMSKNPTLYLLDEPSSALDAGAKVELVKWMISQSQEKRSVLFVSHDPELIEATGARRLFISSILPTRP